MAEHTLRVELPDGDWADVTERPTHAQVNRLYKAWQHGSSDPAAYLDVMAEVVLSFTTAWSVRGADGHELPLTTEGLAEAPFDKVRAVFQAVQRVSSSLKELDPNA